MSSLSPPTFRRVHVLRCVGEAAVGPLRACSDAAHVSPFGQALHRLSAPAAGAWGGTGCALEAQELPPLESSTPPAAYRRITPGVDAWLAEANVLTAALAAAAAQHEGATAP